MPSLFPILRAIALVLVLMASMLGGIFAAAGLCAFVFGPAILDTTLGDTPDRTHPAFILFMVAMVPAMLVAAAGAVFGVMLPVAARWPVAGIAGDPATRRVLRAYLSFVSRSIEDPAARCRPPAE
jgi:hypothetical protein